MFDCEFNAYMSMNYCGVLELVGRSKMKTRRKITINQTMKNTQPTRCVPCAAGKLVNVFLQQSIVSLYSRSTHPPTKYRNPKTEHRVEIYLNISDYM